jgi:hypothetical protein
MSPGDVVLMPAQHWQQQQQQQQQQWATFVSPPDSFRDKLSVWTALVMAWAASVLVESFSSVTRLRLNAVHRCWTSQPQYFFVDILSAVNAPVAFGLVASLVGIVLVHRLGRMSVRWIRYWFRRNFVFVVLSLLRGLNYFRPGVRLSTGVGTVLNFWTLPFALAVSDAMLLLRPRFGAIAMYRFFIFQQMCVSVTAYVEGLAFADPCNRQRTLSDSSQRITFVVSKLQNAVFLFFSLYFLGLLVTFKILTSITTPIIKFSNDDRFKEGVGVHLHRVERLVSSAAQQQEQDQAL